MSCSQDQCIGMVQTSSAEIYSLLLCFVCFYNLIHGITHTTSPKPRAVRGQYEKDIYLTHNKLRDWVTENNAQSLEQVLTCSNVAVNGNIETARLIIT